MKRAFIWLFNFNAINVLIEITFGLWNYQLYFIISKYLGPIRFRIQHATLPNHLIMWNKFLYIGPCASSSVIFVMLSLHGVTLEHTFYHLIMDGFLFDFYFMQRNTDCQIDILSRHLNYTNNGFLCCLQ